MRIERHFFVCANERPEGGKPSCGARGATAIIGALREGLGRHPERWGRVAVTPTGCLGPCFDGPTVLVYPEATWYTGVTLADVPELVERHMCGGEAVSRLVRPADEDDRDAGDDDQR